MSLMTEPKLIKRILFTKIPMPVSIHESMRLKHNTHTYSNQLDFSDESKTHKKSQKDEH
jgi:hypothetical protein